jgi:hypothetical protein
MNHKTKAPGQPICPGAFVFFNRPPQNGDLLRQRKNPGRFCLRNTPRALNFLASLHLTIFDRSANFEFFNQLKGGETIVRL